MIKKNTLLIDDPKNLIKKALDDPDFARVSKVVLEHYDMLMDDYTDAYYYTEVEQEQSFLKARKSFETFFEKMLFSLLLQYTMDNNEKFLLKLRLLIALREKDRE